MKVVNSDKKAGVQNEEKQADENKMQIIVVADKLVFRSDLIRLITSHSDLQVCAEAENVDEVLGAFNEKQIDFAVICSFKGDEKSFKLVDQIKFGCPNLPVLIFSMPMKLYYAEHSLQQKSQGVINQKVAGQIIDSVNYVENLVKNNIFGFAVLVNIE